MSSGLLPTVSTSLRAYSGPVWNTFLSRRMSGRHLALVAGLVLFFTTFYYIALSGSSPSDLRYIPAIVVEQSENTTALWNSRAEQVKQAFLHAYHGYETHAFPHDELRPLSNMSVDNFNGWGVSVIDSLDTMILMGLTDEFERALPLVEQAEFKTPSRLISEDHYQEVYAPFFETVIRYLGGLLSAYAMSHEPILLERADDLAKLLAPAFETPTGFPYFGVNTINNNTRGGQIGILAEIASCQLEYLYLARATGKKEHYDRADRVIKALAQANVSRQGDMFPKRWNIMSGQALDDSLSVGAAADSAHEYLLKEYLMTAKSDTSSLQMYLRTTNHILTHLLYLSEDRELLYVTDTMTPSWIPTHQFEHLSCFFPGLLALGAHTLNFTLADLDPSTLGPRGQETYELLKAFDLRSLHMWAAEGLATSCWLMYADQASGLGPEDVYMRPKPDTSRVSPFKKAMGKTAQDQMGRLWIDDVEAWRRGGARGVLPGLGDKPPILLSEGDNAIKRRSYAMKRGEYFLRPETLESIYLLWRTTGNPVWRERGWAIFEALEREAKTKSGYTTISNVERTPAPQKDEMPSYFLAETLKYLYLLFHEEDLVPLDRWVFNTEAHPLPIFTWSAWERNKFGIPKPRAQ
ncbi:glycoside hydrolase [Amylocystis lapponica]|nr:glycoside hydrolase [Amylocystis lapponica]